MVSPFNTVKELRQRYHKQLQEAIWYIANLQMQIGEAD